MGVTAREAQIIDLYEAGSSVRQIAKQLGLSHGYVDRRVKELCHGLGENLRHLRSMKAGSLRLAQAILQAQHHGRAL